MSPSWTHRGERIDRTKKKSCSKRARDKYSGQGGMSETEYEVYMDERIRTESALIRAENASRLVDDIDKR